MERGESSRRGAGLAGERDWFEQWRVHTRLLRSALQTGVPDEEMQRLLYDCFSQYSDYLDARTASDKRDSNSPATALEAAFMWLGGWRPSCAVVMVYSLLKQEGSVVSAAVTSDQSTCFLTDEQLSLLESLQKGIRESELDLSHQLSLLQMLVADQSMLSALTMYSTESSGKATVKEVMETRLVALRELLEQADRLRLQTLDELSKLLTPVQAARASVAAFEIVFMMRSMGSSPVPRRSLSASAVTLAQAQAVVVNMLPTVQTLVVPIHAGLALERTDVRPVTLSFPIVSAPALTGGVGIQSPVSPSPGVKPNGSSSPETKAPDLEQDQTTSPKGNIQSSSHGGTVAPSSQSKEEDSPSPPT